MTLTHSHRRTLASALLSALPLLCTALSAQADSAGKKTTPKKVGKYLQLRVLPATLTLENLRDARRLVVSGRTADGFWVDLTPNAVYKPADKLVVRDGEGYFRPLRQGTTTLTIAAGGQQATVPVTVKSMESPPVSFVREIMPVLSRTGCNAGTCHGSAKGKNGFKLSLRGYDPKYDYHALISDISGRRFNRAQPAESLMLLKPTQGVAHQGGLVFEQKTRFYPVLYRWIADGVQSDVGKVQRANRIEVLPRDPKMSLPGDKQTLIVLAHYADGTTRDVTRDSVFSSTMSDTATVTPEGVVTAVRRGETSVLVRYEGNYAANGIMVLGDRTGYKWTPAPQYNYIDKFVDAKLQRVKALPSGVCDDAEFLRRASLDITGLAPTPEQARAFLSDPTPSREKRAKIVDRLLDSPEYTDHWTNKWADMLQVNRKYLGERGVWKFRNWIQEQVAANRPYDAFVREVITASGSSYEHPAASYFRVAREPSVATENVTQLFLGIRFSCNKCHDHPFERWTQTQYYQFAANFGRVGYRAGVAEGDEAVFERRMGEVLHPKTNAVMNASFPYTFTGQGTANETENRREKLADWLTSPQNPYFARSYANRVWSYFLGKGIIDPVDDIRSSNPPSNPALLDALTADFLAHKFDVKHLIRTICRSRTYQASITTNVWNSDDTTNFSHAVPRRLTAEQLVDAISRTTGSITHYPGVPEGFRAAQLPDTTVAAGGFLDLFGRPARESPCECERSSAVSLGQTLNLINNAVIHDSVNDPKGRIVQLMKTNPTDRKIIEEMYLAAWSRLPTEKELTKALRYFAFTPARLYEVQAAAGDRDGTPVSEAEAREELRTETAQDLLWALINSPAFLFNR